MARVKRAVNAHKKRRVILERAKGYRGQRSRLYRKAKEQVIHSLVYSYRDRRKRKGDFRRLWIQRINAAARQNGITYNRFIQGLGLAVSLSTVVCSPTSRSTTQRPSRRWSRRRRRLCPLTSTLRSPLRKQLFTTEDALLREGVLCRSPGVCAGTALPFSRLRTCWRTPVRPESVPSPS